MQAAAAAKRNALAAASLAAAIAVCLVGTAGGARGRTDRIPPTPPGDPHVTAAGFSSVSVAWTPSYDNVGVVGYYVYGDEVRSRVDSASYRVSSLGCGESTSIAIAAFDAAGNRSPRVSLTVATAACPDAESPTTPSGFSQDATTQTGVVLSWTPSADNVGVVEYDVYSSSLRMASTAQPVVTLNGLACGTTYVYGVDAVDAAGNRSLRATAYVRTASCSDAQPPTTPTGLAVTARSGTSLSVAWSPSVDDVGVVGYRVSVDGAPSATVTQTSASVGSLTCGTTYTIGVDALDAAGNRSPAAKISAATEGCGQSATTDTTAPTAPTGLSASAVSQTALNLSWSPSSDNTGVSGYDVYRDGTKVATTSGTSLAQSGLSCGTSYSFSVIARDAASNSSAPAQVTATTSACSAPTPPVDTTPPSQPTGVALASVTSTSVTLSWSASTDDVGVAGYRTYVNGSAGATTATTGATVSGLACGNAYTFAVEAFDAAGNRSTRASVIGSTSPCPDAQAPSAPSNLAVSSRTATSVALSWTASSDNVGIVGYGLYRAGSLVGTSGTTSGIFSGLVCNTSYTLSVDAYDAAGNRSSKTSALVSTSACPDTTPPSAPTGLAASGNTQNGLTLTWNASTDNVGVTGYEVYRDQVKVDTVSSTASTQVGLGCGTSYSFGVAAVDASGNRSEQAQLIASTSPCAVPSSPGPQPTVLGVDPATISATGGTILRDDTAAQADPAPGLWGPIAAASPSRQQDIAAGGDAHARADGSPQGNTSFRQLTVQDGDNFYGERVELGNNEYRYGENTGTQTSGTFALYREGDHKITFFSERYGAGFTSSASGWQTIMQMKQAQPYGANGPVDGAPALELQLYGGRLRLHSFWNEVWSTNAPPNGVWIRYALDVTYSQDPAKGRVQVFADLNGDGDFLDSGEMSPVLSMRTLAYVTSQGSGTIANGGSIPSHLRLGLYHDPATYGTTTVDLDNVQVVGS